MRWKLASELLENTARQDRHDRLARRNLLKEVIRQLPQVEVGDAAP